MVRRRQHRDDDAFLPTDLANLEFWFRSDLGITITGAGVSTLADQGPANLDLTQSTDAKRPSLESAVLNGHDALRFDGVDDYMDRAIASLSQPNTVYFVARMIIDNVNDYFFDSKTAAINRGAFQSDAGSNWLMNGGTNLAGSAASDTSTHYWTFVFNGASSELFVDGSSDASGDAGADGWDFGSMGGRYDESRFANFDFFEYFCYGAVHDAATIATVEAYLTSRYAL